MLIYLRFYYCLFNVLCSSEPIAESDDGVRYMVYNRWGRVGIKGQDKLHGPYTSLDCAIKEFELKFFAKTKNQWSSRKDFVSYPKCYRWLEMDYTETDNQTDVSFFYFYV